MWLEIAISQFKTVNFEKVLMSDEHKITKMRDFVISLAQNCPRYTKQYWKAKPQQNHLQKFG